MGCSPGNLVTSRQEKVTAPVVLRRNERRCLESVGHMGDERVVLSAVEHVASRSFRIASGPLGIFQCRNYIMSSSALAEEYEVLRSIYPDEVESALWFNYSIMES